MGECWPHKSLLTITDKNGNAVELINKGDGTYTFVMHTATGRR